MAKIEINNNLRNPHDEKIQQTGAELQNIRISEMCDAELAKLQKPYSQQWRGWVKAANAGSWIGNILSFLTEFFTVGYFVYLMLPSNFPTLAMFAGLVAGLAVASLIEIMKRDANDVFFLRLVYTGEFHLYNFAKLCFATAASVGLSFAACIIAPAATQQIGLQNVADGVVLVDVASVGASYDERIKTETDLLTAYQNEKNSKGILRQGQSAKIAASSSKLDSLHAQKKRDMQAAEATNKAAVEAKQNEQAALGYTLGYVTIGLEFAFMLCIWYDKRYKYNVTLELGKLDNATDNVTQTQHVDNKASNGERLDGERNANRYVTITEHQPKPAQNSPSTPPQVEKRPIGFELPQASSAAQNQPKELAKNERHCDHCGTVYTFKNHNSKFCSETCRVASWNEKTGKNFSPKKR
jgi:hypothetical protein